jgi:RHS repeat-associated protein
LEVKYGYGSLKRRKLVNWVNFRRKLGARYNDPEIGRWLTQDPLGMIDGPNMFAYVGNNPLNWVDPYGLWRWVVSGGAHAWFIPSGLFFTSLGGSTEVHSCPHASGELPSVGVTNIGYSNTPEAVIGELGDIGFSGGIADISNTNGQMAGNTLSISPPCMGKRGGLQFTFRRDALWYNPSTWIDGVQIGLGLGANAPVTLTIPLPGGNGNDCPNQCGEHKS